LAVAPPNNTDVFLGRVRAPGLQQAEELQKVRAKRDQSGSNGIAALAKYCRNHGNRGERLELCLRAVRRNLGVERAWRSSPWSSLQEQGREGSSGEGFLAMLPEDLWLWAAPPASADACEGG